jgi:hypothetical protein
MAPDDSAYTTWLPVIARSLARLALAKVMESDREKFSEVLARVDFLEALGFSEKDSVEAAGSTAKSVAELKRKRRNEGNGKRGKKAGARGR